MIDLKIVLLEAEIEKKEAWMMVGLRVVDVFWCVFGWWHASIGVGLCALGFFLTLDITSATAKLTPHTSAR